MNSSLKAVIFVISALLLTARGVVMSVFLNARQPRSFAAVSWLLFALMQ